jgi:hypothetical protein
VAYAVTRSCRCSVEFLVEVLECRRVERVFLKVRCAVREAVASNERLHE